MKQKTGFLELESGRLFYKLKGKGPAVLFVHGLWMDHRRTEKYTDALVKAGFQLVLVDLPSHGQSTASAGSVNGLIESLKALMTQLGLRSYCCSGYSIGGAVCTELAVRDSRVRRVVPIFPAVSKLPALTFLLKSSLGALVRLRLTPRRFLGYTYLRNVSKPRTEQEIQERLDEIFSQNRTAVISSARWGAGINTRQNIEQLGGKCLAVAGSFDRLAPEAGIRKHCRNTVTVRANHSDLEPQDLLVNGKNIIAEFFSSVKVL